MRAQLSHLVDAGRSRKKVTILILPLAAPLAGHTVPASAFSTYRYRDPTDPVVVAVDTVTSDLVFTDSADTRHYLDLYQRIRQAALKPADSLDFLAAAAEELPQRTGSRR
ncbi:hypothetical protein GCM10010112_82130 [Actinoplanes lobatus]|uniref:DUF5753 domain-containing protein n=1 Tax=Actinoplanes lobatus TaxID=113568 RepID=A0ABQ4AUU3_9ACTN|nr:hypothetical protein GCM10010112_82130 [Actinoplanes lobatus]GIE44708.1 hypothetical protein Alo02nite_76060 [Actinoplanes lobatus]